MTSNRYLITWVGSYVERIKKGIIKVNPDYISFLIQTGNEDWNAFQRETLIEILKDFGKTYDNRSEIVEIRIMKSPNDIPKEMFKIIFDKIREIRVKHKISTVQISIDVTAAPKTITYILTFLAMALSTRDSHIKLLYTPKALESSPKYYAPIKSSFCEKEKLLLSKYRTSENEDKGGETLVMELPIAEFEIFDLSSSRTPYLLSAFKHIPDIKEPPKNSSQILKEMIDSDKELLEEYASPAEKIEATKNKAIHTKLSLALQQFDKWGIVELTREGRWFLVQKTWAGDLITPVIESLYGIEKEKILLKKNN